MQSVASVVSQQVLVKDQSLQRHRHLQVGRSALAQSFIQGDVIETTAPAVGAVSDYSSQVSTGVGTGTGTGTVTSAHTVTAVGGGSGTSTIGQFVTELNIN